MILLMLPRRTRTICVIQHMFPGFDLYFKDPEQPLITAREELDGQDHDLSEVWYVVPGTH